MNINPKNKDLITLHFILVLFGLTGIIGKFIEMSAVLIVYYRTILSFLGLYVVLKIRKVPIYTRPKHILFPLFIGAIVGLHWLTFFLGIKVSNISVTLACLSSCSFFISLIEPIFYKRKIYLSELILGAIIICAIGLIFQVEQQYINGIILGIISSFLASLFVVFNGKFFEQRNAMEITFWEMLGAFVVIFIFIVIDDRESFFYVPTIGDTGGIIFLSFACTVYAFSQFVSISQRLKPFTVSLISNLEPIYTIAIALIIFGESEKMTLGFYLGTVVIILAIVLNHYLKEIRSSKGKMKFKKVIET